MPDVERVVVERRIGASPATVFSFFTSAQHWLQWQGVDGVLDPRPGGAFRMHVSGANFAAGTFLEVVPERRIVFTWGWEGEGQPVPPGSSRVEIELEPLADGRATLLRLIHTGLPSSEVDLHRQGWETYVDRLVAAAERDSREANA